MNSAMLTTLPSPQRAGRSSVVGWWMPNGREPEIDPTALLNALRDIRSPLTLLQTEDGLGLPVGGSCILGENRPDQNVLPIVAQIPACDPSQLGDPTFCADHRLHYPYVCGAMANGIGSADIAEAMGNAGMVAFFGAAGLSPARVETAIDRLTRSLGETPFGFNLIHSPNEPHLEGTIVDLYLRRGIRLVEASAYLDLTLPVVKYRVTGIHRDSEGRIVTTNRIIAKVSRVEVATKFFSPPPEKFLQELVSQRFITSEQADFARQVPMAQDVTAEADSGGHTDNRPAITLIPTMIALRDRLQAKF